MMTWTKTKIAAAIVGAALVTGTGTALTINRTFAQDNTPAPSAAKPAADKPAADASTLNKKDNMGIISVQTSPPVVIASVPAAGSTDVDAAATTEIKVTFNKDMTQDSFSWVQYGKDTFPKMPEGGKAHFTDARTCVLPVKLEPGHPYVIWLNQGRFKGFADTDGNNSVPYLLVFETKK